MRDGLGRVEAGGEAKAGRGAEAGGGLQLSTGQPLPRRGGGPRSGEVGVQEIVNKKIKINVSSFGMGPRKPTQ